MSQCSGPQAGDLMVACWLGKQMWTERPGFWSLGMWHLSKEVALGKQLGCPWPCPMCTEPGRARRDLAEGPCPLLCVLAGGIA